MDYKNRNIIWNRLYKDYRLKIIIYKIKIIIIIINLPPKTIIITNHNIPKITIKSYKIQIKINQIS